MGRLSITIMWCGSPSIDGALCGGPSSSLCRSSCRKKQPYHPDVEVQQWSVQIDHIHLGLVLPPKYAVSSMVGKMKANLSRQLRLGYPELNRTDWGAVLWSPEFFSSTVGLNEAVIRRYVEHQERMDKGQIQLEFEF
jgi:REP-associated tyrosine transposase